jgi:aspartate dehydrogenase
MILGVVGCGAIGRRMVEEATGLDNVERILVHDRHEDRAGVLVGGKVELADLADILERSDLIIEAAAPDVVRAVLEGALGRGADVMILSSGGLIDPEVRSWAEEMANRTGANIYIPSGAIGGMDVLKASSLGTVSRIELNTVKHPNSIKPTEEFVRKAGIDLDAIVDRTLIFEGTPEEAIRYFPRNVNVSTTLTIAAGTGLIPTIRVFLDPGIDRNRHELLVEGDFGAMKLTLDNVPSSQTPGTSELAALSALATLRSILMRTKIGT